MARSQESWDSGWLRLASTMAEEFSYDPSTKVGALLIRANNTVASTGWNGFPRGMADDPEIYEDRKKKLDRVIHAELNACLSLMEPGRNLTLYCTLHPCDKCVNAMIQVGVIRAVFPKPTEAQLSRWGESMLEARARMEECGIEWRMI